MTKHWTVLVTASLTTLFALLAPIPVARADIFQWQYINPPNPGFGKQPSTMLCPDGAGANAGNLSNRNLTMAYLIGADLTGADLSQANLTQADFSGGGGIYDSTPAATLTGANFSQANLTNADFGGYAGFDPGDPGIYYYLGADLTGANLGQANLTGASFYTATLTNANLSQTKLNANFNGATLTGANLTGADVRGASFNRVSVGYFPYYDHLFGGITLAQLYSTASYKAHDLTGIELGGNLLAGANLAGQNLASANFFGATLTGANLTGAVVRGATFSGITAAQLYSTASYQAHDLTAIGLAGNNLADVNLASQNLTNAKFHGATLTNADLSQTNLTNADFSAESYYFTAANLTGANLSQANLTNANFSGSVYYNEYGENIVPGANLTDANLSGADTRGANFQSATLTGANTSNRIQFNGHVAGLDLTAGASLVVRDYDGNPAAAPPVGPLPIVVDQHLAMNATGMLRLVLDADHWDSTISFAPGIPVTLGGTLDLTFAPSVNVAAQSGRTIDLFDWTGVTPSGAFTVSSPYTWNLSKLYTTGEVTLMALPALVGDYSGNGTVGPEDYDLWKTNFGSTTLLAADGNHNGIVDAADYSVWRDHLGATLGSGTGASSSITAGVPEPATLPIAVVLALALMWHRDVFGYRRRLVRVARTCSVCRIVFSSIE